MPSESATKEPWTSVGSLRVQWNGGRAISFHWRKKKNLSPKASSAEKELLKKIARRESSPWRANAPQKEDALCSLERSNVRKEGNSQKYVKGFEGFIHGHGNRETSVCQQVARIGRDGASGREK